MPSVDVQNGLPQGTDLSVDEEFTWVCSEVPAGTEITVYAQLSQGEPWFETAAHAGSITFTAPGPSAAVTAELESLTGWQWTASGANVNANAHVVVKSTIPHEEKKAS